MSPSSLSSLFDLCLNGHQSSELLSENGKKKKEAQASLLSFAAANDAMLYLIGLGLGDEKDITVKGLEAVQKCSKIFLEAYTSILSVGKERLVGLSSPFFPFASILLVFPSLREFLLVFLQEQFYGKPITIADREMVESEADSFLSLSKNEDVAFLVVGDPFG